MLRLWIIPLVFIGLTAAAPIVAQEGEIRHTVNAGDTLSSIAVAYGVTVDEILALNSLNREALLSIGQSLLIATIHSDESSQDTGGTARTLENEAAPDDIAALDAASAAPLQTLLPASAAAAPIAQAAAQPLDPTRLNAEICFAMYQDDNQNGSFDPDEAYLAAGEIILNDEAGNEKISYRPDGLTEPFCVADLPPMRYIARAAAPTGYGLTTSPSLHVNLKDGGRVRVHVGAKSGLQAFVVPTAAPPASVAVADEDSLLMELSGLLVLGLAGVVLLGGLVAALLIRTR